MHSPLTFTGGAYSTFSTRAPRSRLHIMHYVKFAWQGFAPCIVLQFRPTLITASHGLKIVCVYLFHHKHSKNTIFKCCCHNLVAPSATETGYGTFTRIEELFSDSTEYWQLISMLCSPPATAGTPFRPKIVQGSTLLVRESPGVPTISSGGRTSLHN